MGILYLLLWLFTGIGGIAALHFAPTLALLLLAAFLVAGLIGFTLAIKGGAPFTTGTLVYFASRLAAQNLLFPTQVAVLPSQIIRHKAKLIGSTQESINIAQIASIKISTNLLWSDIIIESSGGQDPIVCHGHLNRDAITIQTTIEQYQQAYFRQCQPLAPPLAAAPSDLPSTSTSFILTLHRANSIETPAAPLTQIVYTTTDSTPLQDLLLRILTEERPDSYVIVRRPPSPSAR